LLRFAWFIQFQCRKDLVVAIRQLGDAGDGFAVRRQAILVMLNPSQLRQCAFRRQAGILVADRLWRMTR
jgi:hypothetical protein